MPIVLLTLLLKYNDEINKSLSARLHFIKGYRFSQKKDHVNAMAEYKKALEKAPTLKYVNQNMGVIFQGQGEYEEAIKCYELELKNNPRNKDVKNILPALIEYKKQSEIYKKILYFIERGREYTENNFKIIELISTVKQNYNTDEGLKKDEIENCLNFIRDDLSASVGKVKKFNIIDSDMEETRSLFLKAFNRRLDAINYLLINLKGHADYANIQSQTMTMIKESDGYFTDAYNQIGGFLKDIYLFAYDKLEKEINNTLVYYSSYLECIEADSGNKSSKK